MHTCKQLYVALGDVERAREQALRAHFTDLPAAVTGLRADQAREQISRCKTLESKRAYKRPEYFHIELTTCSLNPNPQPGQNPQNRPSRPPPLQLAALVRSDERDAATEADFAGALDLLDKVDALASRGRVRRDPDRSLELR